MSRSLELLATTDSNNTLWTCGLWDPHAGTSLMTYRGGGDASPRTLSLIGADYIASIEKGKPLLHIWPINSSQTVQGKRFVLPGKSNAFSVSNDGKYCIVGIGEKIYLWQISSGSLLTIITRHYQPINCLKFSEDSRHFVSAAEDGMVMVWSLTSVARHPEVELYTQSVAGQHDPIYMFSDHSLPVTDIYISKLGLKGRLTTVSIDKSCKIYDLSNGELLLNVVFYSSLLSVTLDPLELNVFIGSNIGVISQFSLTFTPRNKDIYVNSDEANNYVGHTKGVTCLSITKSGEILASGSNDESVILWHTASRQQLRCLKHKGPVTNLFFFIAPNAIFKQDFNPSIVIHQLERTLEKDSDSIAENEVIHKQENNFWNDILANNIYIPSVKNVESGNEHQLQQEVQRLQKVNAELYKYSVEKILKDASVEGNRKRKML